MTPGAYSDHGAGGELARVRAERDAALHALARCEAIALDECRTDAQVRADVADTAADAYAPHVDRVRELVRTPLPAHIRAGFRGELATAEGLHAAERDALRAQLAAARRQRDAAVHALRTTLHALAAEQRHAWPAAEVERLVAAALGEGSGG